MCDIIVKLKPQAKIQQYVRNKDYSPMILFGSIQIDNKKSNQSEVDGMNTAQGLSKYIVSQINQNLLSFTVFGGLVSKTH